jgi:rhamnosyltransferase
MDQDSFFSKNDFSKYIEIIKSFKIPQIGMIGLIHDRKFLSAENEENKILITSGSIINVDIAIKVGMFDENLFIDGVDTEFCLTLWGNRYKTILVKSIVLKHSLGFTVNQITPSLRKEYRTIHNKKRIYYIVRNHFYLRNKFNENKDQLPFKPIINEIKNAIFYGNEKAGSFIMALKGYFHFLIKKMGKQL